MKIQNFKFINDDDENDVHARSEGRIHDIETGEDTREIMREYNIPEDDTVNTMELNSIFAGQTQGFVADQKKAQEQSFNEELINYEQESETDSNRIYQENETKDFIQEEAQQNASAQEENINQAEQQDNDESNTGFNASSTANFETESTEQQANNYNQEADENVNNDPAYDSYNKATENLQQEDDVKTQQNFNNQTNEDENQESVEMTTDFDFQLSNLNNRFNNDPDNAEFLNQKIKILKQQINLYRPAYEMIERARRTQEYLQRKLRDIENKEKFASFDFISEIVDPIHWIELSLKSIPASDIEELDELKNKVINFEKGLEIVLSRFNDVLKQNHVKIITPLPGDEYDERYHDAINMEESDQYVYPQIIKVDRRGYLLHNRLVKPASVVVAKKKD